MSAFDIAIPALCAWRENRGGGRTGMQSVVNVLWNRSKQRNTTMAIEAVRPWQFSSMTAKGDPQLALFPAPGDPQYATAEELVTEAMAGTLPDITGGATFYYAKGVAPPKWSLEMTQTAEIANQVFFKEA